MKNHNYPSCVEVSMHNPLLLQARISRMVRTSKFIPTNEIINNWCCCGSFSPECVIEGNMFFGDKGLQFRIPYKTSFIFTWVNSHKKSKLAWGMSLS